MAVEVTEQGLLLRATHPLILDELIEAITPTNLHSERATGTVVGNEIW
ncbi:MAG: AbrB/MazE/SpoVT family DNA-binding domain-containing protein [Candidatus Baltobacteraceae bacterium]